MRIIKAEAVIKPLEELIKKSLVFVDPCANELLVKARANESSELSRWALDTLILNNKIAAKNNDFACQDCGLAVLFINIGSRVFVDGNLKDALFKGVEGGYKTARKSVANSIDRANTAASTPPVIHFDIVDGEKLEVIFLAKGAGAENMSRVFMLTPSKGIKGIIDSVLTTVTDAGANPCPPVILGVGVGGTMEECARLSKYALTRNTGEPSPDPALAKLEQEILTAVNATSIGAQGFGGSTTALAVHLEARPTHIGMLPVAVNVQCHSARHGRFVI